jgi:hypothetical protein
MLCGYPYRVDLVTRRLTQPSFTEVRELTFSSIIITFVALQLLTFELLTFALRKITQSLN